MLNLEVVWKRLSIDFLGLQGSMLRSLGVRFGVWIDAGNCLEFQWIFGISQDPPKVKAPPKLRVIWAVSGALTVTRRLQTSRLQTADQQIDRIADLEIR